jgi:hypothetical protein
LAAIFKRSKKKGEPYTIQYFDHLGKRKTVQGFTDKGLTEELAKKLEGEVRLRTTGLVDPTLDDIANARSRPLNVLLDQFEKSLVDTTPKYVGLTMYRVKRVLKKLTSPHTIDSGLHGRCIFGGAVSPNVA